MYAIWCNNDRFEGFFPAIQERHKSQCSKIWEFALLGSCMINFKNTKNLHFFPFAIGANSKEILLVAKEILLVAKPKVKKIKTKNVEWRFF